jgi:predicted Zn-dependent protease with MMP-like domain
MNRREREQFDALLEQVLDELPAPLHELIERVPLIVEDHPSEAVADEFDLEYRDDLCGLHDGIPLTERSVLDSGHAPEQIILYREGIWSTATNDRGLTLLPELVRQIRITVLHEIGHHFGLDEDDLRKLGYE